MLSQHPWLLPSFAHFGKTLVPVKLQKSASIRLTKPLPLKPSKNQTKRQPSLAPFENRLKRLGIQTRRASNTSKTLARLPESPTDSLQVVRDLAWPKQEMDTQSTVQDALNVDGFLPLDQIIHQDLSDNALETYTTPLPLRLLKQRIFAIKNHLDALRIGLARDIWNQIIKTNPDDVIAEEGVVNAFIQGHLAIQDANGAMEWIRNLYQNHHLPPNVGGLAMMLQHLTEYDNHPELLKETLEWIQKLGISYPHIFSSDAFSDASIQRAVQVLSKHETLDFPPDGLTKNNMRMLMFRETMKETFSPELSRDVRELGTTRIKQRQEVPQGLEYLRRSLAPLADAMGNLALTQYALEVTGLQVASEMFRERQKSAIRDHQHVNGPKELMYAWSDEMGKRIQKFEKMAEEGLHDDDPSASMFFSQNKWDKLARDYLKELDPQVASAIAVTELVRLSQIGPEISETLEETLGTETEASKANADPEIVISLPFGNVITSIGKAIQREYNAHWLQRKEVVQELGVDVKALLAMSGSRQTYSRLIRSIVRKLHEKNHGALANAWQPDWPLDVVVRIGSVLVHQLLVVAQLADPEGPTKVVRPFSHRIASFVTEDARYRKQGFITVHKNFVDMLTKNPLSVGPRYLPMLVPPLPWLDAGRGGYLHYKVGMMRTKPDAREQWQILSRADRLNHLQSILVGLDVLGSIPWKINQKVLSVVDEIWKSNDALAGIPSGKPLEIPHRLPEHVWPTLHPEERQKWLALKAIKEKEERERWSQRCDTSYKIEIARAFLDKTIYFPHNLDFRGRAYPVPQNFHHMSNDLCRGLLQFANAKPLGSNGLRALKIQIANLYGYDKASFDERVAWVEEHLDHLMDCADLPLKGKRFWLKADSPFQFLGACMELVAALRHPSGPENYVTGIPVHLDGSCNGLQHYAALGGDIEGARQVNLIRGDRPADVYNGVATIVARMVEEEADTVREAKMLKGKITRKLIKQTVMTNTYGVTFIGAKQQIMNRLKESKEEHGMDDKDMELCARYVAHKVFKALGEAFEGARKIQHWLNSAAEMVSKSQPEEVLSARTRVMSQLVIERGLLSDYAVTFEDLENPEVEQAPDMKICAVESALQVEVEDVRQEPEGLTDLEQSLMEEKEKELIEEDLASDLNPLIVPESPKKFAKPLRISGVAPHATNVVWTTPLGLPIVQPYKSLSPRSIKTSLQQVILFDPSTPGNINSRKQSTAFPPNFVHSLDATHMFLTALAMKRHDLDFAAVHDSFWSHPSDVDTLAKLLREEFVRLHQEGDIMRRLHQEFEMRYSSRRIPLALEFDEQTWQELTQEADRIMGLKTRNYKKPKDRKVTVWVPLRLPAIPQRGKFDVTEVLKSPYFFH